MFDAGNHVIHVVNGRLAPDSTTSGADVRRIVEQALKAQAPSGIVLHFHGGLVPQEQARHVAQESLYPLYADRAHAYPVFFVWESGFCETVRNNLQDIARESLFREFVKKAAEWLLKSLPADIGFKGGSGASVNEARLRQDFDDWFNGRRASPPEQLERAPGVTRAGSAAKARGAAIDEQTLEANIAESIEGDPQFQDAVQAVYNGLYPAGQERPATRGVGTQAAENSLISKEAADRLFEKQTATTKGFGPISWLKIAKSVAAVVIRSVRRFRHGRDHGMYTTAVEETLRELYVDKLGRTVWWNAMKKDTADAFQDGSSYGGTVFLYELKSQLQNNPAPKITLVGHSAGAVYVCNFLAAAKHWLPDLQFDVIFEAPAATHAMLAETARNCGTQIRSFRQFAMSDALEAADVLVPIIYVNSLLYFVSGLLEDRTDEPLAGMERFLKEQEIYDSGTFPEIEACRQFYARFANSLIWSPSNDGEGRNCEARHHGDFDDHDTPTMDSVRYILQQGFTQP